MHTYIIASNMDAYSHAYLASHIHTHRDTLSFIYADIQTYVYAYSIYVCLHSYIYL